MDASEESTGDRFLVEVGELNAADHGSVICYPGREISTFEDRTAQLRESGIRELLFKGSSKVGKLGVLGKGCVSLVVKARIDTSKNFVALKIRRTDSNRPSMMKDFALQRLANSFSVGPQAISATRDLFAMEYVQGTKIGKWFECLKTRTSKKHTRALVRGVFEQCYRLDAHGLDHGELSNPSKHILLRDVPTREAGPVIIDFESASTVRQPSNLTAAAQFFFLGGWQAQKVLKILGFCSTSGKSQNDPVVAFSRERFIGLLRRYKSSPSEESLLSILAYVGCHE